MATAFLFIYLVGMRYTQQVRPRDFHLKWAYFQDFFCIFFLQCCTYVHGYFGLCYKYRRAVVDATLWLSSLALTRSPVRATRLRQGGFDLLGRSRDSIRTEAEMTKAKEACLALDLDGLVVSWPL